MRTVTPLMNQTQQVSKKPLPDEVGALYEFLNTFDNLVESTVYDADRHTFETVLLEYDLVDADLDYDVFEHQRLSNQMKMEMCQICKHVTKNMILSFKLRKMRHQPPEQTDTFNVCQGRVEHTQYYDI